MRHDKLINRIAQNHGLNPSLVLAMVKVESATDTYAVRYEPGWRWFLSPIKWAKRVAVTGKTERICQQMSWGLMQIMGTVARERGFTGDMPELCVPEVGLEYGCRHLKWLLNRHGSLDRALSAYNTGKPNSIVGHAYAAEVLLMMERENA